LIDLDHDGDKDILATGNLFTSEIETPRNDAGYGVVLINEGNFNFRFMNANDSGFFVNKDAKKVKLLSDKNQKLILVGNNDDKIQVFKFNKN
jgi:hypothetical protein